jgi:hypothetical protein
MPKHVLRDLLFARDMPDDFRRTSWDVNALVGLTIAAGLVPNVLRFCGGRLAAWPGLAQNLFCFARSHALLDGLDMMRAMLMLAVAAWCWRTIERPG